MPLVASPSRLLRWALYGFVFSLPFDAPGRLPLELTTLTGAGFLAVTVLQPGLCYGRRPLVFWLLFAYQYAYWLAYVFGGAQFTSDAVHSSVFYIQGLLIFLACFNLMRDPRIARNVLLTLAVAVTILALMTILGIGKAFDTESGRQMVLGQNANRAARMLCAGLLILVGLVFGRPQPGLRPKWIAWPIAAVIGLAMILGGSRGGLVALAVGLWMFSFAGNTLGIRIRNTLVAMVAIGLAAWGAWQSPVMQQRILLASQGNLAKREIIFPAALQMFKAKPLYGWGPGNQYALAVRLGLPPALHQTRDTHNLFLEVLTATGILGAVPYFTALWLCLWAAWKARRGIEGILPLAQMMALGVGNLTGNYIQFKLQWLILAYAMASWVYLTAKPVRVAAPTRAELRRRRWG
ncbi:MAG: O-antigen ligase family protein [Micromonosporaceae bacterium]